MKYSRKALIARDASGFFRFSILKTLDEKRFSVEGTTHGDEIGIIFLDKRFNV